MVLFNYSTKELTAKVVYYGPGLCGKTTNLQYIHQNLPETVKGKMLSLATKTDRTLFFDFLPIDLGEIRGMQTRVQLYTVPGQVFYNETRKLVLKGADGIVFVADSQEQMLKANVESFRNLEENLKEHGLSLAEMPHVIQFNKRDLPKLASITDMNNEINKYNAPFYETVATTGIGVQDSLKAITKLVLLHLTQKYETRSTQAATPQKSMAKPAPLPTPTVAPPVPTAAEPITSVPLAAAPSSIPEAQELNLPISQAATVQPTASLSVEAEEQSAPIPIVTEAPPSMVGKEPAAAVTPQPTGEDSSKFFADTEIDDLMEEVQEVEIPAIESLSDTAPEVSAGDTDLSSQARELGIQLDNSTPDLEASVDSPVPGDLAMDGVDVLESDQAETEAVGFAPDVPETPQPAVQAKDESSMGMAHPVHIKAEPETATAQAVPVTLEETPSSDAQDAQDEIQTVHLTEVASDDELFSSDDLAVAQLAAAEEQEILVPVEVGDVTVGVKRFKLSIKLRLDPVD